MHVPGTWIIISPPLIEVGDIYIALLLAAHFCHTSFLCLCVLSVYHAGGQTRDVRSMMPGYCWPTVYNAEPTLAQYWVTMSGWMWASVTDGGPTLAQLLFKASCWYYSQHEVGLLTTVVWILASTGDAGPTFNRHWVGVSLHCYIYRQHEALNQCWFYAGPAIRSTRFWTSASFMLGQRRRRWARNGPALGQRLVFAGSVDRPTFVFCTSPGVKILKPFPNWLSLKTI